MEGPPRIALGLARSKRAVMAVSLRTRDGAPAENRTRTCHVGDGRDVCFTTGADGRLTGNRTQTCQVEAGHDCCFTMSRNGAQSQNRTGPIPRYEGGAALSRHIGHGRVWGFRSPFFCLKNRGPSQ